MRAGSLGSAFEATGEIQEPVLFAKCLCTK